MSNIDYLTNPPAHTGIGLPDDTVHDEQDTPETTRSTNGSPNEIKIHRGVPAPKTLSVRGVKSRYPLMEMEIGDCFFVDCDRSDEGKTEERTIRQTVSRYHRRLKDGKGFPLASKNSIPNDARWAVSRQGDDRVGVWRLA